MTIVRKLFLGSLGVAIAVAAGCGGSTDDGTPGGGVDSGIGNDAGSVGDGSMASDTSTTGDTGTQADSGGGGGTIPCGMGQTCNVPSQECCLNVAEGGLSAACTATGTCMGAAVACASAANCSGGQVCCAQNSGGAITSACAPSPCNGMSGQLCAMDNECPMGETCRNLGGGFKVCRPAPPDGGMRDGGRRDGGPGDAGGGG